ncbi:hypothetical protein LINPERPRIM_LOCUS22219 [Linum perenne]
MESVLPHICKCHCAVIRAARNLTLSLARNQIQQLLFAVLIHQLLFAVWIAEL